MLITVQQSIDQRHFENIESAKDMEKYFTDRMGIMLGREIVKNEQMLKKTNIPNGIDLWEIKTIVIDYDCASKIIDLLRNHAPYLVYADIRDMLINKY